MCNVADFVDALSAPIQFLSQAEKRAKQLEGLGIDEKDISDVSMSIRQKPLIPTVADGGLQSPIIPTVVITTSKPAAPQPAGGTVSPPVAGEKEKKGFLFSVNRRVL